MPFLILDSGGVSVLADPDERAQAQIDSFRREGLFPPFVPSAVLVECLTGDPRRDARTHRVLNGCRVLDLLPERTARRAAYLRTRARRGSAVDAIVVATAEIYAAAVLTSDPRDLRALAAHADQVLVVPTWG